jgi:hypothetical protein
MSLGVGEGFLISVQQTLELVKLNIFRTSEIAPAIHDMVVGVVQGHGVDRESLLVVPALRLLGLEMVKALRSQKRAAQIVQSADR